MKCCLAAGYDSELLVNSVSLQAAEKTEEPASPAAGPSLSSQSLLSNQQSSMLTNSALSQAKGKSRPASGGTAKFACRTSARRRIPLLPNRYQPHQQPARLSSRVCKAAANTVVAGLDRKLMAARLTTSSLSGQATNDTVKSLDVSVQARQKLHFTKNEILAMRATSILDLLHKDSNGEFHKKLKNTFAQGLKKGSCHALDLAGKVPFSLLMRSIGVNHKELYVDSALSGGLYSSADAFIPSSGTFLEIKSAKLKAGSKNQFQIKKIRHQNTSWRYLIFVCRTKQPKDWLNPDEYNHCGFWIGVIDRETYMALLIANGLNDKISINVTVTPGTGAASNGGRSRSWLGDYIKWTRFEDIKDINWWKDTFP